VSQYHSLSQNSLDFQWVLPRAPANDHLNYGVTYTSALQRMIRDGRMVVIGEI